MFTNIADWAHQHPTALTLILFVVSCTVSVYGKEIRNFFHNWPRTSKALDTVSYRTMQHDLAEIEALHKNTYNLLLYTLSLFAAGSTRVVIVVAILYTLSSVANSPLSATSVIGLALGMFMGRVSDLGRLVHRLIHYEESSALLKREIAKYEQQRFAASASTESAPPKL
jgi:hypothetical protein